MTYLKFKIKLKQLFTRLFVRLKYIKKFPADLMRINQLINSHLPNDFKISIPGGVGNLCIQSIESQTMPSDVCLHIKLACNLDITVEKFVIYQTHFLLNIEAIPEYDISKKTIGLTKIIVTNLKLISDDYSLLRDTSLK